MSKLSLKEELMVSLYNGMPFGSLTYRPLSHLYHLFPKVNPGTIRMTVLALKNQAAIEKVERNQKVYLTLTKQGLARVFGPFLYQKIYPSELKVKKEWDGFFSLGIINVPESKKNLRSLLRQILFKANFRLWHSGIWLSPHELGINSSPVPYGNRVNLLEKSLGDEKIASYLTIVTANKFLGTKSSLEHIYSLWDLAEIKKNYETLVKESTNLAKMKYFDALGYINLLEWEEKLLVTLRSDPLFPHNFYPLAILREKVAKIFLNLSQKSIL
ncbi:hypothetical protein HY030_03275 [Candidatus Gottesmanbacteria bacterium]|nr:hypothetical protein [Candidatus Gottesmanbacteria bacterium]